MKDRKGNYIQYTTTLEAAGANILAYETFGDYQGTWLALVEYNGEKGIVEGSYGSCSGCDSLQATFDDWHQPVEQDGKYYKDYGDDEITKEEWDRYYGDLDKKMREFGEPYLRNLNNKEYYQRLLEGLDQEDWFDREKKEYCEWAINQQW